MTKPVHYFRGPPIVAPRIPEPETSHDGRPVLVDSDLKLTSSAPVAIHRPEPAGHRTASSLLQQHRAWALVVTADFLGLLLPALIRPSGRLPILAMALLYVQLLWQAGLYRSRLQLSVLDELPRLLPLGLLAAVLVGTGVGWFHLRPNLDAFAGLAAQALVGQLLLRALAYRVIHAVRQHGDVGHRTLLVGAGATGSQIARTLCGSPHYGLRPVGFIDDDPLVADCGCGLNQLGGIADLADVVIAHGVAVVIMAYTQTPDSQLIDVMRTTLPHQTELFVVPRLFEVGGTGQAWDHVGAIPVQRIRRPAFRGFGHFTKRLLDLTVAILALVVLSPLLVVAAIAVRLESGPGVLFRQERVGREGRLFNVLKFRSLRPIAVAQLRPDTDQRDSWSVAGDGDRIGRVGRLIRRTSVDELPQLWNVIRGDMSLVGPRPERPYFVALFADEHPEYTHRLRVPCGLTGLAQVNGLRGDTSISERARYDNYYIENWSFWLDVKIMIATVRSVVSLAGR